MHKIFHDSFRKPGRSCYISSSPSFVLSYFPQSDSVTKRRQNTRRCLVSSQPHTNIFLLAFSPQNISTAYNCAVQKLIHSQHLHIFFPKGKPPNVLTAHKERVNVVCVVVAASRVSECYASVILECGEYCYCCRLQ